jgi:hypothetical protein
VSIAKFVLIAGLTVAAGLSWRNHKHSGFEQSVLATADSNGFVRVLMPDGAQSDTVLILAALNCPSYAARRADDLARRLTEKGIPNTRSNQAHFTFDRRSADQIDRLNRSSVVGNGEIPAVFINGMGRANPTADEVAAEYRQAMPQRPEWVMVAR